MIQVGEAEFIVEDVGVTGVFDQEWIAVLEKEPAIEKQGERGWTSPK